MLCLGKMNQNPTSNTVWEEKLSWFKDSPQYRTLETIDGEPMEFERNILAQDSPHCSSATKSKSSWPKWAIHHNSKDELYSCRCSMTSHGDLKTMKGNALLTPHLWLYLQKSSTRTLVISRTWIRKEVVFYRHWQTTREWDGVAELMMIKFRESVHPVFRATSPLSRGTFKSKGCGNLSIHFCVDGGYDWNCFSHNYFC